MFKRLLIFFNIIDEIQIPVPIQRGAGQKLAKVQEKAEREIVPKSEMNSAITPVERRIDEKIKKIKDFSEYTQKYQEYCLEKTSNQHMMKALSYRVMDREDGTETFFIKEDAFIIHDEHKMLRVESSYFVKYIQQEYNPITQINENAYD